LRLAPSGLRLAPSGLRLAPSKVEGRGSRVEGRGSRVEGRGSRVEGRGSRVWHSLCMLPETHTVSFSARHIRQNSVKLLLYYCRQARLRRQKIKRHGPCYPFSRRELSRPSVRLEMVSRWNCKHADIGLGYTPRGTRHVCYTCGAVMVPVMGCNKQIRTYKPVGL